MVPATDRAGRGLRRRDVGVHLVVPDAKWLVNLLASAIGAAAYVVLLLAIGLKPNERASVVKIARKLLRSGA